MIEITHGGLLIPISKLRFRKFTYPKFIKQISLFDIYVSYLLHGMRNSHVHPRINESSTYDSILSKFKLIYITRICFSKIPSTIMLPASSWSSPSGLQTTMEYNLRFSPSHLHALATLVVAISLFLQHQVSRKVRKVLH